MTCGRTPWTSPGARGTRPWSPDQQDTSTRGPAEIWSQGPGGATWLWQLCLGGDLGRGPAPETPGARCVRAGVGKEGGPVPRRKSRRLWGECSSPSALLSTLGGARDAGERSQGPALGAELSQLRSRPGRVRWRDRLGRRSGAGGAALPARVPQPLGVGGQRLPGAPSAAPLPGT